MTIRNLFDDIFNWKKNPVVVFYFVIPLFLVGMGLCTTYAILMALKGNLGYLVTETIISPLFYILWFHIKNLLKVINNENTI